MRKKSFKATILLLTVFVLLTLFSSCTAISCTVTFVLDEDSAMTVSLPLYSELSDPEGKDGYTFEGWYTDKALKSKFDAGKVTGDLVLYAAWSSDEAQSVNITVVSDGETKDVYTIDSGMTLSDIAVPEREGYVFIGWYADEAFTLTIDTSKPIYSDVTIYEGWQIDVGYVANKLATDMLSCAVGLVTTRYNMSASNKVTTMQTSTGSGVIFSRRSDYYYALTNNHVIAGKNDYKYTEHQIRDSYGNMYDADVLYADESYDLAIVRFISEENLVVADMRNSNPDENDFLVSVGNPGGIINSVSYGKLIKYDTIEVESPDIVIDVKFDVGWHTCPITQGSSGGAVFDSDLNLAGINFASATGSEGGFAGLFIPIEKVQEFISASELFIRIY